MTSQPTLHPNTRIFPASLDPRAVDVVTRLTQEGFEAYLVGGCVRDLLLGHIPKDFDVSTEARPRQIRRIFRNCRVIGRRFKLAHVHFGENIIEVATFRQNPTAESAAETTGEDEEIDTDALLIVRDNVFGTAEEDSVRRDFTINALLYDVNSNEVIDYVGGFEDIENKILRTIGEPAIRFAEDPVRMLRAIKFTSRLDLSLESSLEGALHSCAELIDNSAPARVIEEIFKLLSCGRAERSLAMLLDYGLLQRLLPELADYWAEHREDLVALGRALDFADGGRRRVSNAFLLAVLFHDPFRALLDEQDGGDAMAVMSDLVAPAALRTSIPRRDVAHMKHMLVTQLRLERNRRGRRFRMNEFLERSSTHEAVDLLYVRSLAGAVGAERHAEWAQRLALQLGDRARPGADEKRSTSRPAKKRRRRRSRGGRSEQRHRSQRDERSPESSSDAEAQPRSRSEREAQAVPDNETSHNAGSRPAPAPIAADTPKPAAVSPAADEPKGKSGPGGLKGLVRSIFRKVFDTDDGSVSHSATEATAEASPADGGARAATGDGGSPSSPVQRQSDESAEASPAAARSGATEDPGDESGPPRARRSRRRRRRSRGSASSDTESSAAAADGEDSTRSAQPRDNAEDVAKAGTAAGGRQHPARKRGRGGRSNDRRRTADKGDERASGQGDGKSSGKGDGSQSSGQSGSSKSRSSPRRSGSGGGSDGGSDGGSGGGKGRSRPGPKRGGNRGDHADKERESDDQSGSQRHPEDVEDTFDW